MDLIGNSEKKPLRIFIHASENDNGATLPEESADDWVMANERMAKVWRRGTTTGICIR